MATLIELEAADALFRLDAALELDQQEWRRIYVLPNVRIRIENDLPGWGSAWKIDESPLEQFDDLVSQFCAGESLAIGDRFRTLNHLGDGIWELKTADLRMFGWFPARDTFLGTDLDLKRQIIDLNLYRPYCDQAVRRRNTLDLNPPKFLPGVDPNVVVSDWYYP